MFLKTKILIILFIFIPTLSAFAQNNFRTELEKRHIIAKNKGKIKLYRQIITINEKLSTQNFPKEDITQYHKIIIIDASKQKLTAYENGQKVMEYKISAGNEKFPTPKGRFRVVKKHQMMWSKSAEKWMPYWMEFYQNGKYGIHAFPLDPYKKPLYDKSFLGVRLGGGCVRLLEEHAKNLYNWSNLSTKVFIFYSSELI